MTLHYWEDFKEGDTLELGSVTVSQEEIIEFARKYDPQPFHVDPEKAKETSFKGLAASGWHTCSLFMRMMVDELINKTVSMGSPGVDEIRWLKPVRPGDTLQGRFIIKELIPSRSRPEMGVVRAQGEMLNQHGEVVMTLKSIGMFGRKPQQ